MCADLNQLVQNKENIPSLPTIFHQINLPWTTPKVPCAISPKLSARIKASPPGSSGWSIAPSSGFPRKSTPFLTPLLLSAKSNSAISPWRHPSFKCSGEFRATSFRSAPSGSIRSAAESPRACWHIFTKFRTSNKFSSPAFYTTSSASFSTITTPCRGRKR